MEDDERVTGIGVSDFRDVTRKFGIKNKDRSGHVYCIGKTGTGKSTLLMQMAKSDVDQGHGLAILDPHGDVAQEVCAYANAKRSIDVVYVDPCIGDGKVVYNPLWKIAPEYHHVVASGLISTFKKIWADSWGPRMEYILRMALLTLLEHQESTLLDVQPLLTDKAYRERVLHRVTSSFILDFWINEFEKYPASFRQEAISPVLNKLGIFASSVPLRNCLGVQERGLRFQEIMDGKKILIANLSKGSLGEDACSLLGSLLLSGIWLSGLYRAKKVHRERFYVFVDEMHSFVSLSFVDMLAEARKYGICLFLAHQYVDQLHEKIRSALLGNVGTMVVFRVGAEDAEVLAKEFYPVFDAHDLVNLPRFSLYIKLMIDGATSKPFSAKLIPKDVEFHK